MSHSASAATRSAYIPLASPVYHSLDKLDGLGLIDSALQGSRPYTRIEAARLTATASQRCHRDCLPVAREILARLQGEFREELNELAGAQAGTYIKPVRSVTLINGWRDGADSIDGDDTSSHQNAARQFALEYNQQGFSAAEGHHTRLIVETDMRQGRWLLLSARPQLVSTSDDRFDADLLDGLVAVGLGPFELSAGRQSLWWGPGYHGALILSTNAQPLDMVRITNPTPALLPGFLQLLGPTRLDMFLSKLEKDRHIAEPYLFGMRVNIKPRPWLELGASRVLMYGGEGQPSVGPRKFAELFFGKGTNAEAGEKNVVNQIAAFDARIKFPFLAGAELYGELGGEDEAGYFIAHKAWILGLYLPRIEPSGRLSLRLEYADLSHESGPAPFWYRHGTYRSGYTYEQKVLGHHVGGDARSFYAELRGDIFRQLTAALSLDYQQRGMSLDHTQSNVQPGIDLTWRISDHASVAGGYRLDFIDNFRNQKNNSQTHHLSFLELQYRL